MLFDRLRVLALALVAAVVVDVDVAHAGGINHFEAAAGPHNYVVTNHPAVLPHLVPSGWLLVSYANDPLVFRNDPGKQIGDAIVANQVNAEIAAALGLFDRFELAITAPAYFMNGAGFDGQGLTAFGTGDLRVMGKALLTPWNDGPVASFRLSSDLIPIAQLVSSDAKAGPLAGDALPNVTPAFSVGFNSQYVRLGVDVGVLVRAPRQISEDLVAGTQVTYGAGAEVSIVPDTLFLTADVFGRASPAALGSDSDRFPLEGDLALKYFVGPILLMAGGGTGLVPDYGAPDFRVFGAIGYFDRPKPEEETVAAGKPEVGDRDGDGLNDDVDECPDDPEDVDEFEDDDGCPDPDNDKDGIFDKDDECPMEPEDRDRWQDDDGCPEDDNDGDGIEDGQDECPNDAEVKNGFEDEDGCPDEATKKKLVVVKRDRIEITDKVYFAYDSDRILPKSYELLDNVGKVINDHTEIDAIFVQGHTDSDGNDAYNLQLSDRRANSVMRYLIEKTKVDAARLKAKGFGETKPIADNKTEAGKQNNRRVEFVIENGGDMAGKALKAKDGEESETKADDEDEDEDDDDEKDEMP